MRRRRSPETEASVGVKTEPEGWSALGPRSRAAPVSLPTNSPASARAPQSLRSTACQPLCDNPAELVATAGDCLLVIIRQTLSVEGVHAIQRGFEQLTSDYERVGYCSYIDGNSPTIMAPAARGLMAHVVGRHTQRIGAAAIVVGGDGFRAKVVRGALSGIHLASRAQHPMRPFPALEPALAWYEATWPQRLLPAFGVREALIAVCPEAQHAR
jgi:hypothetical protein